jgi:DNA-binding transcriptional LysR family regulator
MFDWNDLRFFLELSRSGRLVDAGRRLRMDHTTVGRRIAALEASIGARGYALTEAGQRLLAHAEAMETQSIAAQSELSGQDAQLSGVVRLATPEAFGSHFLSPRLGVLLSRHPGLEIELVAETRPLSLSKREADLAVMLRPPETGRLLTTKLCRYRLSLYAAPSYLATRAPLRNIADLAGHDVVTYVDDLLQIPELRSTLEVLRPGHARFRSTSVQAQTAAVRAGLGIGLLHDFAVAHDPGLVRLLPAEVAVWRDLWLVIHEDLRPAARIDVTRQFLVQICSEAENSLAGL